MQVRTKSFVLGAVIVLLLSSCSDTSQPQPESDQASIQPDGQTLTLDEQFAHVAELLPGFGGVFYDSAGNLNVYIKETELGAQAVKAQQAAQQPDVKRALATVFGTEIFLNDRGSGASPLGAQALPNTEIKVLEGRYSFVELAAWHRRARDVLSFSGVVSTDIDEARNRLTIGLENVAARQRVKQELSRLGVPTEAVLLEIVEPIRPLLTLRDRIRSVRGGTQISFDGYLCTLGFNVFRGAERGFITNSHCTTVQGGTEGTVYYQASIDTNTRVGRERRDPLYFTGGACPSGYRCRYSDTAFVRYDAAVSGYMATIARVLGNGRTGSATGGSITIDSSTHRYVIAREVAQPIYGQRLDKMGRTTGHTYGSVTGTCANFNMSGTDIVFLCQGVVGNVYSAGGDSGSPVFSWRSNGQADLYGILWGGSSGSFVFSPMSNIERSSEMGPLTTHN